MKKITKLLSVLMVMGALGAGTAALTGCGDTPVVHNGVKTEAKAATCTVAGNKEYYTCTDAGCEGKYYSDAACTQEITDGVVIPALGHNATKTDAHPATCTVNGNIEYYTCSGTECDGKYYKNSTCTEEYTATEIVIAAAHTPTKTDAHPATCSTAGNIAYYTCSGTECAGKYYSDEACTHELTAAELVDPAGHKATRTEAKPATCTVDGNIAYYTCSGTECAGKYYADEACTQEYTAAEIVVAKLGHHATRTEAKPATCTVDGNIEYYTCSGTECAGKYYKDEACTQEYTAAEIVVAKLGHKATRTEAKAATCTVDGNIEYYTCSGTECAGKYYADEACTKELTAKELVVNKLGHKATRTEAKPATCTADGNIEYYTCSGTECAGKYYADEACTQEIKDGKVIPKLGHTPTKTEAKAPTCSTEGNIEYYTCSGTECAGKYYADEACTKELKAEELVLPIVSTAHVDEKVNATGEAGFDNICDLCNTKFFATGKFYNEDSGIEIEVKADGKVVYNGTEATMSEISDEGTATFTANETVYTLKKTATGYDVSWTFYGTNLTRSLIPAPEEVVSEKAEFAGVYTPDTVLVYKDYSDNYYKVNKIEISADGKILYEVVKVDNADGTTNDGNIYTPVTDLADNTQDLKYNKISGYPFTLTALTAGAATIDVLYSGNEESVTFTKTADAAAPVVPTALPVLANGDKYVDADKTNVLKNMNGNYYINENAIYLLKEETVGGNKVYLVRGLDSNYDKVNYKLTFITADEVTTIKLATVDGTEIATLNLKPKAATPDVVSDGNTENKAECEENYGFFKVTKTGWYVFTATDASLQIYTVVTDGQPSTWGAGVYTFSADKLTSKPVYLEENTIISANKPYDDVYTYTFTATYSETEPEPDWAAFTDGVYTVANMDSANEYYVKAVVSTYGKYVVSVSASKYFADRGAYFEINKVRYGYKFDSNMSSWSQYDKLVYTETLLVDDVVKIRFGCEYQYLTLGDVTVYFETEEQYNARLAAEATPPTFTAEQKATYSGSYYLYGDSQTAELVVSDSGITFNGEAMTFVRSAGDSYIYTYNSGDTTLVTFNADGTISFKDETNYVEFTAYKAVPFDGFTAEQQGEYTYSGTVQSYWGDINVTITITLGEKTLTYSFDEGYGASPNKLRLVSITEGVYVWSDANGATITFTFDADGNIAVSEDTIGQMDPYTASKGGTTGGEEEVFSGFTAEQQGEYTYTYNNGRGDATVTITIGETTVNYVDSYAAPGGFELTVTLKGGVYTCDGNFGSIVFSFNADGGLDVTQDMFNQSAPYTAVKGGTSTGGEEASVEPLVLGDNAVKGSSGFSAYAYTFTGEAGKSYTISWESADLLVSAVDSMDEPPYDSGATVTADENGKFTLYMFSNAMDANYNYVDCEATITIAEAAA